MNPIIEEDTTFTTEDLQPSKSYGCLFCGHQIVFAIKITAYLKDKDGEYTNSRFLCEKCESGLYAALDRRR